MEVLEGLLPKDIRGINSYMKFFPERIMNENGDFVDVVPGTLSFLLTKRNPIVEFKSTGDKYLRSEIEDGHQVVFTFVHGDGNRCGYKNVVHY